MASSSSPLEGEPHVYDYVKIKFKIEATNKPPNCPAVTWKEYKRQWLVLCTHIAPHHCFLTYCLQEDRWLLNRHSLPQIKLENFALSKKPSKATTMSIMFGYFTVKLEFDSVSKLQQWAKALETIRRRMYVELVRCPDHPHLEKEYAIQLEPDRIVFYSSESKDWKGDIVFEWTLAVIKRVKYHNHVGKVQVEVGRSAESGGGIYYFIGFAIKRFFSDIKKRMEGARQGGGVESTDTIKPIPPSPRDRSSTARQTTSPNSKSATLPSNSKLHVPHITSPIDPHRYQGPTNTTTETPPPLPPRPSPKPSDALVDDILPYAQAMGELDLISPYDSFGDINNDQLFITDTSVNTSRKTSEPTVIPVVPKPRTLPRSKSINTNPFTNSPQKPIPLQRSLTLVPPPNEHTTNIPHYQPLSDMTREPVYDPVAISSDDPVPVLPTIANTVTTNAHSTYTLATQISVPDDIPPPVLPPKPLKKPPPPPPYPPPS